MRFGAITAPTTALLAVWHFSGLLVMPGFDTGNFASLATVELFVGVKDFVGAVVWLFKAGVLFIVLCALFFVFAVVVDGGYLLPFVTTDANPMSCV
jgi:hypothetical protein